PPDQDRWSGGRGEKAGSPASRAAGRCRARHTAVHGLGSVVAPGGGQAGWAPTAPGGAEPIPLAELEEPLTPVASHQAGARPGAVTAVPHSVLRARLRPSSAVSGLRGWCVRHIGTRTFRNAMLSPVR